MHPLPDWLDPLTQIGLRLHRFLPLQNPLLALRAALAFHFYTGTFPGAVVPSRGCGRTLSPHIRSVQQAKWYRAHPEVAYQAIRHTATGWRGLDQDRH